MDIFFRSLVAETMTGQESFNQSVSHIIIQKQFSHLEQCIRDSFRDLPQVCITVDRRWHNRRRRGDEVSDSLQERRRNSDRRCAIPALDFIMGGMGQTGSESGLS